MTSIPLISKLSRAEKIAIALALAMLLLQVGAGGALEYRVALLADQPWRLVTGHFVHVNWQHALINAAALCVVARLFAPDLTAARQFGALLGAALVISACLMWIYPSIQWYRGLSGALHGVFFAGATVWLLRAPRRARQLWLPAALFIGGWVKVAFEQPGGAATPYAEWLGAGVVPQAHLAGAACGTALGLVFAVADTLAAGKQQRAEQ